ncbi:Uncharacterised protein [Acidipropionibacterium jensenii]|uniref:Uncharacterized protein n=1 Tax=Acidipropionibacterium jensenii TaxID=1749 RepID=A0A3S4YQN2_9ACTN|nr:hypothetical protein [Acidipropionibacterium jensenii]VEI04123.1 Uncharacterised protein [Acidipropionibacterium jensenii]
MHILTNEGLRKAEQVEVQCILANLHNDLSEIDRKNDPANGEFPPIYLHGFVNGIRTAQDEIRKILDTYDDPDFIRDFFDGQGEA